MSGLPEPGPLVGMKLAAAIIHLQEAAGPGGHEFDTAAAEGLLEDPEVQDYLGRLRAQALLPLRRDE